MAGIDQSILPDRQDGEGIPVQNREDQWQSGEPGNWVEGTAGKSSFVDTEDGEENSNGHEVGTGHGVGAGPGGDAAGNSCGSKSKKTKKDTVENQNFIKRKFSFL